MIKPFYINKLEVKNNLILAPMAGYGDIAFRRLCFEYGAGMTVSEMVSVKGLIYNGEKTKSMLQLYDGEKPAVVQLFGSDPSAFYEAIKNRPDLNDFDMIDINMGCPVPKITKQGEGSALMKNPIKAAELVRAAKEASSGRPVSVKMRIGYKNNQINAVPFAVLMQEAGADMITVHGRTTEQKYSGFADWNVIAEVKKNVSVPVAGSGDVDFNNYKERNEMVDALMIGRGAIGRPWIFSKINGRFADELLRDVIVRHIDYMTMYFSSRYAAVNMRKHLTFYLHTVKGQKEFKNSLYQIETAEELKDAIYKNEILKTYTVSETF